MSYTFDGTEGSTITAQEAATLRSNYEAGISQGDILGVFMGKDLLGDILEQQGCMGIRFYFGKDDNDKLTLVLRSADKDGNDIGIYGNRLVFCPPNCPPAD